MQRLLFIASIQHGEPPTGGGAQAKNQLLLAQLQKYYDVAYFDTWHKSAVESMLMALWYVLRHRCKCVLSISGRGALGIGRMMRLPGLRREVYYFVIGGDLGFLVEGHKNNVPVLKSFRKILVEGHYMKEQLNRCGLDNVSVLPNFKPVGDVPTKKVEVPDVMRFVFLGRLIEEKGVGLLVEAALHLHKQYADRFTLTFYGAPSEKYNKEYFDALGCNYINYGGFLNLNSQEGVEELSHYDVMTFPTFFKGEGFPGVLIDAFKAGLPVIASDFHANPDVICRPELGVLVRPNDLAALQQAMERFILNPAVIPDMARAVQQEVRKYDIDVLLSRENLGKLLSNK